MTDVVREEHFKIAKDKCIFANAGHFDVEINKEHLMSISKEKRTVRKYVDEYIFGNGKKLYLLGEGRLINLVGGQGHPVEIMDLSFSIQALTAEFIIKNHKKLEKKVYPVPRDIDVQVSNISREIFSIDIDVLNEKQKRYMESWNFGT